MKYLIALILISAKSFAVEPKTIYICDSGKYNVVIKDFDDKANITLVTRVMTLTVKATKKVGYCLGEDFFRKEGRNFDCDIKHALSSNELELEYINLKAAPGTDATSSLEFSTSDDDFEDRTLSCKKQ